MEQATFTLNEVLMVIGMVVAPVVTAVAAHFTATISVNRRIDRVRDEMHKLELKSLSNHNFKNELNLLEGRLEENFGKTLRLAISENNDRFEQKLVETMKMIIQDKVDAIHIPR